MGVEDSALPAQGAVSSEQRVAMRVLEQRFRAALVTGAWTAADVLEHRRLMEGVRTGRLDPLEVLGL